MSSRPRLLVLADIPVALRERLAASLEVVVEPLGVAREEEVAARVPGFHGLLPLLVHPVGERVFAAAPQLEIVANCAAGLDNVDLRGRQPAWHHGHEHPRRAHRGHGRFGLGAAARPHAAGRRGRRLCPAG